MAQLTKAELLKISEAMEQVYADIQDELLINIARHIGADYVTPSGEWEIRKLSDLGMINDESIKIIAKHSKLNQRQVKTILNNVTKDALKDIEPGLKKASEKGLLTAGVASIDQSQAMQNMMSLYYDQAVDKMNMTNATLLDSAVDMYSNVVQDIANEERILNSATGTTLSRYTTRQQATRKAMRKMADEGLTGFIDRAGRQWSPEAYVSMVIRTTAHNVNIDAVKTRQEEYGSDLFQVSVHGGARPLCYPYQDKIYSWGSATGGTFEDGAGRTIKYGSFINDTSQAKPAGLFGINCGHHPFPIIPGYSIVHKHYVQPMTENDEEYALSQKQRALERDIRAKKRQYEIDKVSGASEADLKLDAQSIRDAQATMRGFIKETGRTRIYSREQIEMPEAGATVKKAEAPRQQRAMGVEMQTGADANNYFEKESKRLLRNNTVVDEFYHYSMGGFEEINDGLRDGFDPEYYERWEIKDINNRIKRMDKFIEKAELKDDIVVHRLMTAEGFEKAVTDGIYQDKAFISTTAVGWDASDLHAVEEKGKKMVRLNIQVPPGKGMGTYINSASAYEDKEFEYLLARNTKMQVLSKRTEDGETIYEMMVLSKEQES